MIILCPSSTGLDTSWPFTCVNTWHINIHVIHIIPLLCKMKCLWLILLLHQGFFRVFEKKAPIWIGNFWHGK
jgi:hypothetical protein